MIRVLHIGKHLCPRTAKLAISQVMGGEIKPYRLGFQAGYPHKTNQFALNCVIDEKDQFQFRNALEELEPLVDIIHYHNEPDWPVKIIKAWTNKPLIWDVHDLQSVRTGTINIYEQEAYQYCDGILTVSDGMEKICANNKRPETPLGVYGTRVPENAYPELAEPHEDELFLCTGLNVRPRHYRNWVEVLKELHQTHMITVISAVQPIPKEYTELEIYTSRPTNFQSLIKYQSSCEAALVGFPYSNPLGNVAMPNKLFEAIAAGIPVVCIDPDGSLEMSSFIRKHRLGAIAKSGKDVPKALKEIRKKKIRENVAKVRFDFSMDKEELKVRKFYEELLDG